MADRIRTPKPNDALEELVRQHFSPEGKPERISRALAALYQQEPIHLQAEEWKWVAENADLEDQF